MLKQYMLKIIVTLSVYFSLSVMSMAEVFRLYYDPSIPQISFAAGDIKAALEKHQHTVQIENLSGLLKAPSGKKVILATGKDKEILSIFATQEGKAVAAMRPQSYALRTTQKPDLTYWVIGGDANGTMYGGFEIAENISLSGIKGNYDKEEAPYLLNRGMKLNLPLDSRIPTYAGRGRGTSPTKAIPHVWDMKFWKNLIDLQARNRYNMLSVWVHHPFPALVKLADYPNACLPSIEGFNGFKLDWDHDKRVAFWREVMRYAHDRGMKFYFFNWNIHLDYAKTIYPDLTDSPDNKKTIDYMSKCLPALIETYPELDGFGISGGDNMHGKKEENTKWTWDAMGNSVKNYLAENPKREFNLIHRVLKTSANVIHEQFAPLKNVPNANLELSIKYAIAHMYSTSTPKWGNNDVEGVAKLGMKTWLTVRNDDYFYFNWGDPKFAKEFIKSIPHPESVVGMYIGIDNYSPSRTYFAKNPSINGQLEVERRWYMEAIWGRIGYNPEISDDIFKNLLAIRYPKLPAKELFDAWTFASRSLPKVTELIMGDWKLDFEWYPEGCWSDPKRCTGFRTIDDFGKVTEVASGSNLASIPASAKGEAKDKKTSYVIADELQEDAKMALSLIKQLNSDGNADVDYALSNIRHMAYLSGYYAHKVRGATFKVAGEKDKAKEEMAKAYCWWIAYTRAMDATYLPDTFRSVAISPDWKFADEKALKEYTDLGGTGIPDSKSIPELN